MAYKVQASWGGYSGPTDVPAGTPREVVVAGRKIPTKFQLIYSPNDDEDRPALTLLFEVKDGTPRCIEVVVRSSEWGREVRRSDLDYPLEDLLERTTLWVGQKWADDVTDVDLSDNDEFLKALRLVRRASRGKGPTDADLAEVAEIYRSNPQAPNKAVQARFKIKERAAAMYAAKAREKGFL